MKTYEKLLNLQKKDYELLNETDSRDLSNKSQWRIELLDEVKLDVAELEFRLTELESCIAHKDRFIDNLQLRIKELERMI
jgi:hypothetical protein